MSVTRRPVACRADACALVPVCTDRFVVLLVERQPLGVWNSWDSLAWRLDGHIPRGLLLTVDDDAEASASCLVRVTNMRPFSVLQTLWRTRTFRCVLVTHLQPPRYAVHLFDGPHLVRIEIAEQPEEAGVVAATLCSTVIDHTA